MKSNPRIHIACGLAAMIATQVSAQDTGKFAVEAPIKAVLETNTAVDIGKRLVESPLKSRLANGGKFVNSKVRAGLVNWHPSYADAKKRAKISGKPVLLFQLLGKLDDAFC